MIGYLISNIYNKETFYRKVLDFYIPFYNEIILDLFLNREMSELKKLRAYKKNKWLNQLIFRKLSYSVNHKNLAQFKAISSIIPEKIVWGLLNNDNNSLVFNGYGEILFKCYSKDESDKLKDFFGQLVKNDIIGDFEMIEDE